MLMSLSLLSDVSAVHKVHSYHSRQSLSNQRVLFDPKEELEKRQKTPGTGQLDFLVCIPEHIGEGESLLQGDYGEICS